MTTYGPGVALIVVDLQNDFATREGSLYVRGGEEIVDAVNAQVERATAAGSPVFWTQDWHPEVTPHFVTSGGVWPPHCVAGTAGAEFHTGTRVTGEVIRKGVDGADGYSGFSVRDPRSGERTSTVLGDRLVAAGCGQVVVVGLAGDYCVKETALDARRLGLDVVVPLELTRFVNLQPGDDERAVAELRAAGVQVDTPPLARSDVIS
ncbi:MULTISPECIES: isochorismatase family protein [unclassified Pseudofrankia]|uniref:isochorismatase family protein n=1 Tax=unclassified Pseudofrankia TaxID=2994372 RepID=UPI0008D8F057|nr:MULTISPECIES: isochorismatase family protein [unclassified Pseudofrankia]MDT3444789.1 isochorismatase family protein [Pseudofrankia sp. BMG5.37]OHV45221.1 isochorismatase [Pseudofrankia sp. BMG5.36]